MSRIFAWILLVLSVAMLALGLTHLDTAKPAALLLWAVVAAAAIYFLFVRKGQ